MDIYSKNRKITLQLKLIILIILLFGKGKLVIDMQKFSLIVEH